MKKSSIKKISDKAESSLNQQRDTSLDFLRGLAVVLMVITHVGGKFYDGQGGFLDTFVFWGATVCFTTFLFVSSSVTGIKIALEKIDKKKILIRFGKLLLIYYITAFCLHFIEKGFADWLNQSIKLFTLQYYPEFTEFLLAFILFSAVILIIPKKTLKWFVDYRYLILSSVIIWALSQLIQKFAVNTVFLYTVKNLLISNEKVHSFGILSYFPIFAVGLWWGGVVIKSKEKSVKTALIAFLVSTVLLLVLKFRSVIDWNRWPPSVVFLLYGISFSFAGIVLSKYISKIKFISDYVTFCGENALIYYISHVFYIVILVRIAQSPLFSEVSTFALFFIILLLTTLTVQLINVLSVAFHKNKSQ